MTSSLELIRKKFESGVYSLYCVPSVLNMNCDGVFINEKAPNINIVEALEDQKCGAIMKENVPTPKLIAKSSGDWSCRVLKLPKEYFRSRERLEEILIKKADREDDPLCIQADRISVREAITKMKVELSVNMEYYMQNMSDFESDLTNNVPQDIGASDKPVFRRLEQELFYKTVCRIFGGELDDEDQVEVDGFETFYEKSFMIRYFNILSIDGNGMLATASRDNYYLIFFFEY